MRHLQTCLLAVSSLFVMVPAPAAFSQAAAAVSPTQEFQHVEDNWSVAFVNKDQYGLENLLGPGFIGIGADGSVRTRNQYIADTLAGVPAPVLSMEQKVVNVRVVSDVAVVEGTYILHTKDPQTQRQRDERGIFTHVFQRQRNAWSCINAQRTAVVDEIEGGKRKKNAPVSDTAGTKSKAELPFHIPLLHKGDTPPAPTSDPAPAAAPAPAPQTQTQSPQ